MVSIGRLKKQQYTNVKLQFVLASVQNIIIIIAIKVIIDYGQQMSKLLQKCLKVQMSAQKAKVCIIKLMTNSLHAVKAQKCRTTKNKFFWHN